MANCHRRKEKRRPAPPSGQGQQARTHKTLHAQTEAWPVLLCASAFPFLPLPSPLFFLVCLSPIPNKQPTNKGGVGTMVWIFWISISPGDPFVLSMALVEYMLSYLWKVIVLASCKEVAVNSSKICREPKNGATETRALYNTSALLLGLSSLDLRLWKIFDLSSTDLGLCKIVDLNSSGLRLCNLFDLSSLSLQFYNKRSTSAPLASSSASSFAKCSTSAPVAPALSTWPSSCTCRAA